jgi:capsular exopolysaccharide synthesis family protein
VSIREYARALITGWWMIVIAMAVGAGAAMLFVANTQPVYAGTVTFFVNTTPVSGVSPLQGDQYAQQRVATYVRLISSDRLAAMIKEDIDSDRSVSAIASSLSGESPLNTVLLTATATGGSRAEVMSMTESVSTQFVKMIRAIDPTVSLEVTSGPALLPGPVEPRTKLDIGLGVFAGLVVGAGAAITRRALDSRVRSAADLRSAGIEVLGVIGRDRRARKAPLLIGPAKESARTEAFRKLRTNLRGRQLTDDASVIVVTSSVYGEGKSLTAANLALTCAYGGQRVLLVDADLRRPRVTDYWGLKPSIGLVDVLAGRADVDDCLYPGGLEHLTLLSGGHSPSDPGQVIGSPKMRDLLTSLRNRFDAIVIDTPPLLPVTDAALATSQADGAILVVRYGKTRLAQVISAADALESAGARLIGCVVNMAPTDGSRPHPVKRVEKGAANQPTVAMRHGVSSKSNEPRLIRMSTDVTEESAT